MVVKRGLFVLIDRRTFLAHLLGNITILEVIMRNSILRTLLFGIAFLASAAYAAHGHHSWQKIETQIGDGGRVVCTWHCDGVYGKESHTTTTSGRSRCPNP